MEKVDGIGGVFFRAKDPAALARWYRDNLGVDEVPQDYDAKAWETSAGTCVFAPFPEDTEYFGAGKAFMVNFRVQNMDAMVAQLEANGNSVERSPEAYPNGLFAWVIDPEGNKIELWEPK